jgi:hypothetical protein
VRHPLGSEAALQAPHQLPRSPTLELVRAQHNPGLGKCHEKAHAVAAYVTIVACTICWKDFAHANGTTVTRRVATDRRKPAFCVREERFFDDTVGTIVLKSRSGRSNVHTHVRTAPDPWPNDGSRAGDTTYGSEGKKKGEYADQALNVLCEICGRAGLHRVTV